MNLSQILQALFASVKGGLAASIGSPLITFFQNTATLNPLLNAADALTYVSQLDLLRSAAVANLTKLGPAELIQLNETFSNEMQSVIAAWVAKNQPPPAAGQVTSAAASAA